MCLRRDVGNLITGKEKKALVVDDSAFMRKFIADLLNSHPKIEVVGTARNGKDAIDKVKILKPDVVTLDVEMPLMNGLEALQEIMKQQPTPVVMLSSTTKTGAENTMLAMDYGAVDFIAKPGGAISLNLYDVKDEIIEKVYAASNVQVSKLKRLKSVGRMKQEIVKNEQPVFPIRARQNLVPPETVTPVKRGLLKKFSTRGKLFVMIGTSTGGPRALQEVLTKLPKDIQAPILVVQHMPPGFTKSLADRLDGFCEINVKEAENGEPLENGTAYIAPGGKHLKIKKLGTSYYARLDDVEPPRAGHRPSVNVLFESAAEVTGARFLTVIMTGMGNDGMEGTARLKELRETITIAESSETSVVYGMPRAIVDKGLADEVVKLTEIAATMKEIILT